MLTDSLSSSASLGGQGEANDALPKVEIRPSYEDVANGRTRHCH